MCNNHVLEKKCAIGVLCTPFSTGRFWPSVTLLKYECVCICKGVSVGGVGLISSSSCAYGSNLMHLISSTSEDFQGLKSPVQ